MCVCPFCQGYAFICVFHYETKQKVMNIMTKKLIMDNVCAHPFSGSLDLLTVTVQVGQNLLTHLFYKRSRHIIRTLMSPPFIKLREEN